MKQENEYKMVGEYKYFISCRFCGSSNIQMVIDLGLMPLAGGFIKSLKQKNQERFYPLQLNFCCDCFLLQVNSSVNPDILFKNYFYFSSSIKTLISHFENIAKGLHKIFIKPNKTFIIEIGANDGTFIRALIKHDFKAFGVDPAANVVKTAIKNDIPIINSYFTEKLAEKIIKKHGKADAIYSFHSMAHIENMHDVMRGVKKLLKKDGFLAMEVHYLGDLLRKIQYDMLYHEHQFYYSLLSLKNFFAMYDMEIFNAQKIPMRGGSIMYYIQNKNIGTRKISSAVKKLRNEEINQGLHNIQTYKKFSYYIEKTKADILKVLGRFKLNGKSIAGYGASGRGTILMNYCGLNKKYLDFVIDDAPAKHGAYTPGTHLKIVSSKILAAKNRPDAVVLFAWPFFDEVKKRNINYSKTGGKFIIPLPKVKII